MPEEMDRLTAENSEKLMINSEELMVYSENMLENSGRMMVI